MSITEVKTTRVDPSGHIAGESGEVLCNWEGGEILVFSPGSFSMSNGSEICLLCLQLKLAMPVPSPKILKATDG